MTGRQVERRLAAVLAADISGYSRLMGADEVGTLNALKAIRREVVDPAITAHNGRIVKTTGDGMLVEFASAVDAVTCAMTVQDQMAGRNVEATPNLSFRIGINVGDIIIESDDIFGDGVNVAARVENECVPGGVCLSGNAFEHIRGKTAFTFDDLGERSLKNIDRPVRLYAARRAIAHILPAADTPKLLALPDKPSIAVLPFQNMSGEPEQEYFVDGLVEDIITALSRIKWLFVIARNSTFTYKNRAIDVRQVGRDLGVRYVLEGSVRKSSNRLRITGQLIDTTSGGHIWADRYDGNLEDVFDLQDRVTANVAGAIEPKLRQAEIERVQTKATESLTAYDYYLQASALFYDFTKESLREAQLLLEQALRADRRYSSAYALAALCRSSEVTQGWKVEDTDRVEALRLARLAAEFGKDDPSALAMAGRVLGSMQGDAEEGLALIERALALNPNAALAWQYCGWVSWQLGRHEQCIEYNEKALRLSPLDAMIYRSYAGIAWSHFFRGEFKDAIVWADKAIREQPHFLPPLRIKIAAAAMIDRFDEMGDALQKLRVAQPDVSIRTLMQIHTSRLQSQRDYYEAALRKAGLT